MLIVPVCDGISAVHISFLKNFYIIIKHKVHIFGKRGSFSLLSGVACSPEIKVFKNDIFLLQLLKSTKFLFQFFPSSPTEDILDFGTIGMQEKRDLYFALLNKGPVKVVLRGWGGNITGTISRAF
jgi:hypothetical protein